MEKSNLIKLNNGLEIWGYDHRLKSSDEIPVGAFLENEKGERGIFLGVNDEIGIGWELKGDYDCEYRYTQLLDVQLREGWKGKSFEYHGHIDEEDVSKLKEFVGTNKHYGNRADNYYQRMEILKNAGIYLLPMSKKVIPSWKKDFSKLEDTLTKARELGIPVIFDERVETVDYVKKKKEEILSKGDKNPVDKSIFEKGWNTMYLVGGDLIGSLKEAAKFLRNNKQFFEVSEDLMFSSEKWNRSYSSAEAYFTRLENAGEAIKWRYSSSFIPKPLTNYFKD
ncbi:hypothetical protein GW931_03355 [archaeon]|nr:hypothetical protein [archaeon]